jgi:hypothetical protein
MRKADFNINLSRHRLFFRNRGSRHAGLGIRLLFSEKCGKRPEHGEEQHMSEYKTYELPDDLREALTAAVELELIIGMDYRSLETIDDVLIDQDGNIGVGVTVGALVELHLTEAELRELRVRAGLVRASFDLACDWSHDG